MGFYEQICGVCPDKRFIEPGSSESGRPRHAAENGGGGEQLDAAHTAQPWPLFGAPAQNKMLDHALSVLRDAAPTATAVRFSELPDNFGYMLDGLIDADGRELLPPLQELVLMDTWPELAWLYDAVGTQISDLADDVFTDDRIISKDTLHVTVRLTPQRSTT